MPDCYQVELIDIVLGIILGHVVLAVIKAVWLTAVEARAARNDGSNGDG